ncbi:fimbrial protein [Burkholderia ubonensis]|nr:fimbrial protein [Burkholderia ubonensis]KVO39537.1 hypothetical protein WJ75_08490 [Burkholderia ubonensis]KWD49503.1 hypothetical protein WL66_20110 [Burkholderia ubonensis]KWD67933.1 hypothetical protein WL67_28255 [Burkholderia ubonensis]
MAGKLLRVAARVVFAVSVYMAMGIGNSYADGFYCKNRSVELATLPSIKVASDAPVGTVLWRQDNVNFSADCGVYPYLGNCPNCDAYLYRQELSIPGKGLSLELSYERKRGSVYERIPTGQAVTTVDWMGPIHVTGTVSLSLVKTGNTPTDGVVGPSSMPVFKIGDYRPDNPDTFTVGGLNNIRFVANTCTVDAQSSRIQAPLGTVRVQDFTGRHSYTTEKSFQPIRLNCGADLAGAYNVSLTFNATPDPGNAPGVLALTPDAGVATGVGIQLLMNGAPVAWGKSVKIGATPDPTLSVPLTARYYQTGDRITAGVANGTATFVVNYN